MSKLTLKACRVNAGYTQGGASKLLGVSNKTLWKWEKGLSLPKADNIRDICELYNVSYEDIIFFKE